MDRDIAIASRFRRQRRSKDKERHCLKCRQQFMSAGPHNRLCNLCRRLDGYEPTGRVLS